MEAPHNQTNEYIEPKIVDSILEKVKNVFTDDEANLITIEEIKSYLSEDEISFIDEKILNRDQKDLGVNLEMWGDISKKPDLVKIDGQIHKYKKVVLGENGEETLEYSDRLIRPQYLPEQVLVAYRKLNESMRNQIGKEVLVQSGFRSRGYQLLVFLNYLKSKKYNIKETAKLVALPGYSEHEDPTNPAIDFLDPEDAKFIETEQYKWMKQNAHLFGFYESFPEGNNKGIQHEPWHWKMKK